MELLRMAAHLVCYEIQGHDPNDVVNVRTQFFSHTNVAVDQALELRLPATQNVGGLAVDLDASRTPVETPNSPGNNLGVLAGVVAGAVTAGALALGGAAWYARRRWAR